MATWSTSYMCFQHNTGFYSSSLDDQLNQRVWLRASTPAWWQHLLLSEPRILGSKVQVQLWRTMEKAVFKSRTTAVCFGRTACVGHHVAGSFMCRQPQQKSGSKQPRSNQHQYHAEAQEPQPFHLERCFTPWQITAHKNPSLGHRDF